MSGPSPRGPPADIKQEEKITGGARRGSFLAALNGSSGTVTVSAGERFVGNVGSQSLQGVKSYLASLPL